jgi:lipopolysaccharide assembly outer membrane protein LptD (OstA)
MEHTPWKPVIFGAAASLILLFIVYFITLPKQAGFEFQNIEKILEFKQAFIGGHEEGKKVWSFYAQQGWSGKDKAVTYLEGVSQGQFYNKKGELLLRDLNALRVKAQRYSKVVEAYGLPEGATTGESKLTADISFSKVSGKRKYADLLTDYLKYTPNRKWSELKGHIRLKDPKLILYCGEMEIDHDKGVAYLRDNINIKRKDLSLTSRELTYFSDEERLNALGSVEARIKSEPKPTRLLADRITLFADENKDFTAAGNLLVFQGSKTAVAEEAVYNQPQKKLQLKGKVKTVIEKARAILKEDTAKKLKSEEARKLLKEKTVLTSDSLEMSTKSGDAVAMGSVVVNQKGREAKAEVAIYNDKSEDITLTGKVYLKKQKEWIKCQSILVSVKNETFEAVGSVEAEFKL